MLLYFSVACLIVGVVSGAFAAFHIYNGVKDSLSNARVGGIYNFVYEQPLNGESERYIAKVLSVVKLSPEQIRHLTATSKYRANDRRFERTPNLVTAQTADGKIRNFYAERATNVRRPLLGGVVFKTGLASLLF